ncbi:MAG: hypothetical protein SVM86_06290, partial [Candidatus Cloacimonadota bacterium]|nr:hypothetical protein [Candidatus Cloacimonadota bacterium]
MKFRFLLFILIICVFTIIWIAYLFSVQILDPHNLKDTVNLRLHPSKIIIPAYRGNIYDSKSELLVNSNKYYLLDEAREVTKQQEQITRQTEEEQATKRVELNKHNELQ